jgi:hypothetical protein
LSINNPALFGASWLWNGDRDAGLFLGKCERTHPEPHSRGVERFLAMVRFEGRSKLAELPSELVGGRDVFV